MRDYAGTPQPAADAGAAGQAARGAQAPRDRACSRPTASASSPNSCAAWASTTSTSAGFTPDAQFNPDFSLRNRVLGLQTGVLNQLMSDTVLSRLLDSEIKVSQADQALTLHELFAVLRGSIWSELKTGGSIPGPRRDLQREHVRRIARGADPAGADDAGRCERAVPRGGEAAFGADQGSRRERQPRRGDARAPDRIRGHARRSAEGADGAPGCRERPSGGRGEAVGRAGRRDASSASSRSSSARQSRAREPLRAARREPAADRGRARRRDRASRRHLHADGHAVADRARRRGARSASTRTPRSRCRSTTSSSA